LERKEKEIQEIIAQASKFGLGDGLENLGIVLPDGMSSECLHSYFDVFDDIMENESKS